MIPEGQIAKSYDLNILASVVGRCSARKIGNASGKQIREAHDEITEILDRKTKPLLPHTDPEAATQLDGFAARIEQQHQLENVSAIIPKSQIGETLRVLASIRRQCADLTSKNAPREFECTPQSIADFFGFPLMWSEGASVVSDEYTTWSQSFKHPEIPLALQLSISEQETRRLIAHVSEQLLDIPMEGAEDIYVGNSPENYNLFWSVTPDGIDYFTPSSYDLATQLSFDVPHNVAHLAHLNAVRNRGVYGYIDDIQTRTYFEAVAVLAEHQIVRRINDGSYSAGEMLVHLNPERAIDSEDLNRWVIHDRAYEFRLRNARLHGDLLTIQGASFDEAVAEVQRVGNISEQDARGEVRKYYAWTGLNSIYTLGYRRLLMSGINNVKDAIYNKGKVRTTWNDIK